MTERTWEITDQNGNKPSPEAMAKHIRKICIIESIQVVPHSSGRAWRRRRKIGLKPIKSEITYAVALHEIGHLLGPRQSGVRLDKEVGAWEWAKGNALVWTWPMEEAMRRRLQSYLSWARRSKQAKAPSIEHPIYAMAVGHD